MLSYMKLYCLFVLFCVQATLIPQIAFTQLAFKRLTINDGLSQNVALCMIQDKKGFIWIGTEDGLNRYDGYEFRHYKNTENDKGSISNSVINAIAEDKTGNLWVATADGLNYFDSEKDRFTRIETVSAQSKQLNRDFISVLLLDGDDLWVGTIEGLKRYHTKEKKLYQVSENRKGTVTNLDNRSEAIFKDNQGVLWFGSTKGLTAYRASTGTKMHLPQSISFLKKEYIRVIKQDNQGHIWFGSERNGIFVYDPKTGACISCESGRHMLPGATVRDIFFRTNHEVWIGTLQGLTVREGTSSTQYVYRPENETGLSHNSIRCILEDRTGNVWLGTYAGGLNVYLKGSPKFSLITERALFKEGLNHPVVSSILEDEAHNLWIGTEGGGLNFYDTHTGAYRRYKIGGGRNVSDNIVKSLARADKNHMWVGTYNGLRLFDTRTKSYTEYSQVSDPADNGSKQIYALRNTEKGLWIGTNGGGLRFLQKDNSVRTFKYDQKNPKSISSNNINSIAVDEQGNLWLATQKGLNYFDTKTAESRAFYHNAKDKHSISNDFILSVFVDSKDRLWVGTNGGGLNLLLNGKFYRFMEQQGIASNVVHAINQDHDGNIWISTNQGLTRLTLREDRQDFPYGGLQVANYTKEDGLQSNQFASGATIRLQNGTLFFGGIKGITSFQPSAIKVNPLKPEVVFTDILVKNRKLHDAKEATASQDGIILAHDYGSITFKFSALNFLTPEKNQYAYRLEGLKNDQDWHYVRADQRLATYTNLSAGTYYFRLKAANNDGLWNDEEQVVKIKVLPPFWKTWWAYCVYGLVIVALLYFFYYYSLKTATLKNELHYEHLSHLKDQELAEQKINFFTNISHEIKTPLTLILAPLDNMLKTVRDNNKMKPQLLMMKRNGERLSRLIHQLLDFRKFESGNMLLKNTENDLVKFLEEICTVFESYAAQQHVQLELSSEYTALPLWFDADKLEKIMYNLLSNAVKFSRDKGKIQVRLKADEANEDFVLIEVEDNGIGIAEKNIPYIFEQFQHSGDANMNSTGTGIGLAFSKGLAELLGGTLHVNSREQSDEQPGYTCFTIQLPLIRKHLYNPETEHVAIQQEQYTEGIDEDNGWRRKRSWAAGSEEKKTILVVEDNKDLLEFMVNSFSARFVVHYAGNGKEALEKLKQIAVDIIISDVMMPVMNGIEFCKKVKSDIRISHIPFILLTARTPAMYKIEGFEIGADDYMTKPFNMDVLEARVNNLLSSRREIMERYKTELSTQPQNVDITSPDDILLAKAMDFIEKNLSEPRLNVEEMAKEVGVGRGALYRKIKALTGKTAIEFIRTIRIKRAAQLLKQKKMNINEVVYSVGFTDVDYFRKCFKEEFGMTPREYIHSSET
ncbi:two-component regulator propeller domain-containing protein [Parapedobacter sp. SGR-10]|uniref:hybrid sensor histidine kinase/response regulator transcription factor n=1 Tax=Parapedobacter sp. SGR-10 TaxID=2710879 RepID=UPI00293BD6C5|nr:two-component regulator propeller domain-containing protein [Parapedobacter sp. SGR-10]